MRAGAAAIQIGGTVRSRDRLLVEDLAVTMLLNSRVAARAATSAFRHGATVNLGSLPVKALEDATDEVTLAVTRGEVFGFIGFNGAGKSTTSNMLCTLARPTSGTARPSLGWL